MLGVSAVCTGTPETRTLFKVKRELRTPATAASGLPAPWAQMSACYPPSICKKKGLCSWDWDMDMDMDRDLQRWDASTVEQLKKKKK